VGYVQQLPVLRPEEFEDGFHLNVSHMEWRHVRGGGGAHPTHEVYILGRAAGNRNLVTTATVSRGTHLSGSVVSHVRDDARDRSDDTHGHGQPHVPHYQSAMDIGQTAIQTEGQDREGQHEQVPVRVAHEEAGLTTQSAQADPQVPVLAHQLR
jgi:hypothetical protein